MSGLEVSGLCKAFGEHRVLTDLALEVPAGSLTAVLGPSGSGKTTLLRVLAGFERPEAGTVRIGGNLVDGPGCHVPAERRAVGYVPQEVSLFPHLNVEANVAFGLPREKRRGPVVHELLETVGLGGLARRYPHQLSGGQQQRVALARALAVNPSLVLLDEPFAALDAHLREAVRAEMRLLLREAKATAVLVTHDQDEALSTADHVAVMRAGRVAQAGTPEDLYTWPVDAELAAFLGEANLIPGTARGATVETALGILPTRGACSGSARSASVTVLVRPEQIRLRAGTEGPGLAARVLECGYHGHDTVIKVKPEDSPVGSITVRAVGDVNLARGAPVRLEAGGEVLAWPERD